MSYSLLPWGTQCNKIELLQKKTVRVLFSNLQLLILFKRTNQLKLTDLYTRNLLKLYYKLYRNKLPDHFDNFLPEYLILI